MGIFLNKRALVTQPSTLVAAKGTNIWHSFNLANSFANNYRFRHIQHTLHDCLSQIKPNLMIGVTKLSHYRSFICYC